MYKKGDFYVTCPISGFTYMRSEMRRRWDGLLVHKSEWNPRQPQDTIILRPEIVPRNVGLGEQQDTAEYIDVAYPLISDNGLQGSFTDYIFTADNDAVDGDFYIAFTSASLSIGATKKYVEVALTNAGFPYFSGSAYYAVFTTGEFSGDSYLTDAVGFGLTPSGLFIGNFFTDDTEEVVTSIEYGIHDKLAVAIALVDGDYIIYLYYKGNLIAQKTVTITTVPTLFSLRGRTETV